MPNHLDTVIRMGSTSETTPFNTHAFHILLTVLLSRVVSYTPLSEHIASKRVGIYTCCGRRDLVLLALVVYIQVRSSIGAAIRLIVA